MNVLGKSKVTRGVKKLEKIRLNPRKSVGVEQVSKICLLCEVDKPIGEYYKKSGFNTHMSYCKNCDNRKRVRPDRVLKNLGFKSLSEDIQKSLMVEMNKKPGDEGFKNIKAIAKEYGITYGRLLSWHLRPRKKPKEPKVKVPKVKEPEVKEPEVKEPEVKEPNESKVEEPEVKEPKVKKTKPKKTKPNPTE